MRAKFGVSTVCYLFENDKVLFLQFKKKWGQVFCPPGGKAESIESPTECIIREFKEETGLDLINPTLKGVSYWNWEDEEYGIIFVYTAKEYHGELQRDSVEGMLEWVKVDDIPNLRQFDMNDKFTQAVLDDGIFEGSFKLNKDDSVKEYTLRKI